MSNRNWVETTLLVTDIEGSTRAWEADAESMSTLLERHDSVVKDTISAAGGSVFKHTGDGFASVFDEPSVAVQAAVNTQILVLESFDDLKVRVAVYTGRVESRDGDYFGVSHNRAARLLAACVGGQILLSSDGDSPPELPEDVEAEDLGGLHLRDVREQMRVFRIRHPDLPTDRRSLRALDYLRTNLPTNASSFIGRDEDVQEISTLLREHRLVTLIGPGGVGKTRLALFVGAQSLHRYPDGVWFCELAPAKDPAAVPAVLAGDLGLGQEENAPEELLLERLLHKRCLIVLDNCEHLLAAVSALADRICRNCPMTSIIATSRTPLGVHGERVVDVKPLTNGGNDSPAVKLFLDRAHAARNGRDFGFESMESIESICEHLDGLPLAIELAAARTRSMSPAEIDDRLGERFRLLTGGRVGATGRQRTLESAVDWSYHLCDPEERSLFDRLSVFAGGFTLEAVEEVCADDVDRESVFDLLNSLVDRSLVVVDTGSVKTRYHLLEILRAYGSVRLRRAELRDRLTRNHIDYYVFFSEQMLEWVQGPREIEASARLVAEYDNLATASARSILHEDLDPAMRIVATMFHLAYEQQRLEVFSRCERTINMEGAWEHPKAAAVAGLAAMGRAQMRDWEGGITLASRAIMVSESPQVDESILPHYARTQIALWSGRLLEAHDWSAAMIVEARRGGSDWELARALGHGAWATSIHDPAQARPLAEEAMLAAARTRSPSTIALVYWYQAQVFLHEGNLESALRITRESESMSNPTHNKVARGVVRQLQVALHDGLGDQQGRWESALESIRLLSSEGGMTFLAGVTILQVVGGFAQRGREDIVKEALARLTASERDLLRTLGTELPEVVAVLEKETNFISPLSDAEFAHMLIEEIEQVVGEYADELSAP